MNCIGWSMFPAGLLFVYNYTMAKLRGHKIRERRHAAGVTQEDLAAAVRVSVSSINRFERNKGEPKASTLWEIARVLKCRMEDFF